MHCLIFLMPWLVLQNSKVPAGKDMGGVWIIRLIQAVVAVMKYEEELLRRTTASSMSKKGLVCHRQTFLWPDKLCGGGLGLEEQCRSCFYAASGGDGRPKQKNEDLLLLDYYKG